MMCRKQFSVVLFVIAVYISQTFAVSTYTLTSLGDFSFYPQSINDSGQVVGYGLVGSQYAALLYSNNSLQIIAGNSSSNSSAVGINNNGQIIGESQGLSFIYANNSIQASWPTNTLRPSAINDNGQVVGQGNYRAVMYDGGTFTEIGVSLQGEVFAEAINNNGQVVIRNDNKTYIYDNESLTNIGSLEGTVGGPHTTGKDINNAGQVVGHSNNINDMPEAFLYDNGEMTNLGTLGHPGSMAYAINELGQIVGDSSGYDSLAFLYQDNTMYDLNDLLDNSISGWILNCARDINESGQIIGFGTYNGLSGRAFLLTPTGETYVPDDNPVSTVPAPGALILSGLGVGIVTCFRRKTL